MQNALCPLFKKPRMLAKCLISSDKFLKTWRINEILKKILKGFVLWESFDLFAWVWINHTHEFILKPPSFCRGKMVFNVSSWNHHAYKESQIVKINVKVPPRGFYFSTFHEVWIREIRHKSVETFILKLLTITLEVIGLVEKF